MEIIKSNMEIIESSFIIKMMFNFYVKEINKSIIIYLLLLKKRE